MKVLIKVFVLVLAFTISAYAEDKRDVCDEILKLSPETRARLRALIEKSFAEADAKAEKQRAESEARFKEEQRLEKERLAQVEAEIKSVTSFAVWTKISDDAKLSYVKGDNALSPLEVIVVDELMESLTKPEHKAFAQKMYDFMKKNNGFQIDDGRGDQVAEVGELVVEVKIYETRDGQILGGEFFAHQTMAHQGHLPRNKRKSHYVNEAEAEAVGASTGESYRTFAYFDEKAKALEFEYEMSYDQ